MQELAKKAGMAKQTIVDIEGDKGNPTVDTLERLAAALDTSVRALVSDVGAEVMHKPQATAKWTPSQGLDVRRLDYVYGSGYVLNTLIRLDRERHDRRRLQGSRGMLRHCYVVSGRAEMGPEDHTVVAGAGDFVRFPGEGPHVFAPVSASALVLVCSTMPQQSMSGLEDPF